MQVEVVFFASLRDRSRTKNVSIELSDGATVKSLVDRLVMLYPDLTSVLAIAVVAVNQEHVSTDTKLRDGDKIAMFPPVSGG